MPVPCSVVMIKEAIEMLRHRKNVSVARRYGKEDGDRNWIAQ
jgi:hypothetical protein